jgi:hypothetical protein
MRAAIADRVRYLVLTDPMHGLLVLAGWRALSTSRGRVLYVDDLVTDPVHRGREGGEAPAGLP